MLELRTFGGAHVRRLDGGRLEPAAAQRRSLALLSVLAVHESTGVRRDRLLALLWPDGDPERSRHALTQSLYNVRRALRCDDAIKANGADVRLNTARMTSDVGQLEALIAAGHDAQAILLYTGPFLEGFELPGCAEFEQWASGQRLRLQGIVAAACNRVANAAAERADWPAAIDALRRQLALDPLSGRTTLTLMRALRDAGDRSGAIQQGAAYCALIRSELEIEPDASITEFVAELKATPGSGASFAASVDILRKATQAEPALTAAERPPERRRWRRLLVAAGVVVAVGLASLTAWRLDRDTNGPPDSGPLLIAPFRVSGADGSLAYLRDGMAELLSARLADDSSAHVIDPGFVMRAWNGERHPNGSDTPRETALRIARRLGAGRAIVGGVVGSADRIFLTASLYSVANAGQQAKVAVSGPSDSIASLVDQLAAKLLASSAGEGDRLSDRLTPSVAALRAFLDGEAAYRRGDYLLAIGSYERAVARDSSFGLAAMHLALAADRLNNAEQHDRALALAWANRNELNERDRAHLIAFAGPRYPAPSLEAEQMAAWERAVAAAPDRADVWYELGERLARFGAVVGLADAHARARAAVARALDLDSGHQPARRLLIMLAARMSDTATLKRIATPRALRDSVGAYSEFLRWRVAVAFGDRAELRRVHERLALMNDESLRAIAMASINDAVAIDDGEFAMKTLAARARSGSHAFDMLMAEHSLALNEGRSLTALRLTSEIRDASPGSHAYLRLRVLDALYGGGDVMAADAAAVSLASYTNARPQQEPGARAEQLADECVIEQWRLHIGDRSSARRAIARLRAAEMPRQTVLVSANQFACATLLEAALAVETGRADAEERVEALDSLMLSGPAISDATTYANIVLARLYQRLGNPRAALAAFRRRSYMSCWPRYLATIRHDEAQLASTLGDTAIARASLARYTALRRNPDPTFIVNGDTLRRSVATVDASPAPLPTTATPALHRAHRRRAVGAAPRDK